MTDAGSISIADNSPSTQYVDAGKLTCPLKMAARFSVWGINSSRPISH